MSPEVLKHDGYNSKSDIWWVWGGRVWGGVGVGRGGCGEGRVWGGEGVGRGGVGVGREGVGRGGEGRGGCGEGWVWGGEGRVCVMHLGLAQVTGSGVV